MKTLFQFAYLQAISCIFPVIIFLTLGFSKYFDVPFLPRYDFILFICIITQIVMLVFQIETVDEFKVICLFHIIGLFLEIYKVHMGSWAYPEHAYSKVLGVPLYSGFMYASVASYICQSFRNLQLQINGWPSPIYSILISVFIYANFFTHHYLYDFRWILTIFLFIVFFKTKVTYKVFNKTYKMPLTLSFFLIGFFIWLAENITTFLGAWQYPNQAQAWSLVHIGKISSWFLLVVISIIIVAQLKFYKGERNNKSYVINKH